MDTMTVPTTPAERSYALYLRAGKGRFYFRNSDRGVTLTPERINWTASGRADGAPFRNIRSVHMESGGDWKNATNACVIRFGDGFALTLTDANEYGGTDDSQTPVYRAFVQDLHKRLIATGASTSIAFTSGYTGARYYVVMASAIVLGIIAVPLPLVLWLMTGESKAFFLTIGGGWMMWPMIQMMQRNAPRSYDPRTPPGELME